MTDDLYEWIKHHEGFKRYPYRDITGHTTIGWGRNLTDVGLSFEEAEMLFHNDFKRCREELMQFDWFNDQPLNVRSALFNMCFNLGLTKLLGFKRMIAALEEKNYTKAAMEALDSLWAKQVGDRAKDVAVMMNGK